MQRGGLRESVRRSGIRARSLRPLCRLGLGGLEDSAVSEVHRRQEIERANAHSWMRPEAVAPISSILTRTGLFIDKRESSETDSVTVALKRRVWRERGAAEMISSSSARKPCVRRSSVGEAGRHEEGTYLLEHTISLVENEDLYAVHVEAGRVTNVVDETSRSRDDDIGTELELGFQIGRAHV